MNGQWTIQLAIGFVMAALGTVLFAFGGDAGRSTAASAPMGTSAAASAPMGTAFTYQAQLKQDSVPVGQAAPIPCEFTFRLFDDASAGNQVGTDQGRIANVEHGLFTVNDLDFGASAFNGEARWLEIDVECPGDGMATTLNPRQPLTPTPYALQTRGIFVDDVGNVGIGTDNPGSFASIEHVLHIANSDTPTIRLEQLPGSFDPQTWDIIGNETNFAVRDPLTSTLPLKIKPGAPNNSLFVASTGNVGIGTTTPSSKLDVAGNATFHGSVFFDTLSTLEVAHGNNTGMVIDPALNSVHLETDNSIGLTLTNSGRVGIATETPTQSLHVAGNVQLDGWIGTGNDAPVEVFTFGARALHIDYAEFPDASGTAPSPNLVGGSLNNTVTSGVAGATIAGGGFDNGVSVQPNRVTDSFGTVSGGRGNQAGDDSGTTDDALYATVGGGVNNTASGPWSTVGGGEGNTASEWYSTVGGGLNNTASWRYCTVSGGESNTASNLYSTVGGGFGNMATGVYSIVPGGRDCQAGGFGYNFAAGRRAKTDATGTFVWADAANFDFPSPTEPNFVTLSSNQFLVRSQNGVVFVTAVNLMTGDSTAGVQVFPGGGSWSSWSDRNAKANVEPVNGRDVLQQVAAMPVSTWNYKAQDPSIRHIGPMAQDFHAAFGVGEKETMITTVDADGVALAAIQGLYEIVQEKEAEIATQKRQIASLSDRLEQVEALLAKRLGEEVASAGSQ